VGTIKTPLGRKVQGRFHSRFKIIPTLCVGMPDAERHWMRYHAERGNDQKQANQSFGFPNAPYGLIRFAGFFIRKIIVLNK